MEQPSAEQVAWVFKKLVEHAKEGGSFRHLIYNRMGFKPESYAKLNQSGGQYLTNLFYEVDDLSKQIFEIDEFFSSAKQAGILPKDYVEKFEQIQQKYLVF